MFIWWVLPRSVLSTDRRLRLVEVLVRSKIRMLRLVASLPSLGGYRGWLRSCPIVAILRGIKPEEAGSICTTLEEAGIVIVEVLLNSPNALSSIAILSRVFVDRMLIGAGTLTDPKQVMEVATAGGQLIVTPHADTAIVRAAKTANLFAVPGFLIQRRPLHCFKPVRMPSNFFRPKFWGFPR
jgi:hypothetical protein